MSSPVACGWITVRGVKMGVPEWSPGRYSREGDRQDLQQQDHGVVRPRCEPRQAVTAFGFDR